MVRRLTIAVIVGLVLTACGGDSGDTSEETTTTTVAETSETTEASTTTTEASAPETTEADTDGVASGPLSQACQDLWVAYVKELDPIIDGRPLLSLTEEEANAITAATEPIEQRYDVLIVEANCPEDIDLRDDFELLGQLLDLTEREAPGALPFIEFIAQQAGYYDDETAASGDCDEDLSSLQAFVAEYGAISNLDAEGQARYTTLVSSLLENCQAEALAYIGGDEHQAFLNG